MHNLIPQFIQENFAAGNYRGEFSCVGLFLDISGFSTMMDDLMSHGPYGAEILAGVMSAIFTPLAESIHSQGGFIAGLAGDAFTALFPLQTDQAAALQQAIAASWQIQQAMAQRGIQQTPFSAYTIQAKIGLALGEAAWGIVASPDDRRAVYYFRGSAIDGSAAAEHLTQGGQIVMDAPSFELARDLVRGEAVQDNYRIVELLAPLPAPQPVQVPRPDRSILARFYPESVLEQVHRGEFRQLVSLFISLPAVRNEAQLFTLMQTIFELLDSYGGLFSQLDFGDKGSNMLIFWGTPAAYENDIERALNFILALQSMTSIPLSAGISYQISHAGFIGSPYMEDFTGYGRGINLAARFMTAAPRGEIWVDEAVFRRAQARFEFDDLGEMRFKGFAEAQPVFVLIDRKAQSETFYSGEIIGRQAELDQLAAFYQPVCAGQYAGALVVFGEAGIGKSRLVHEFQVSRMCAQDQTLWAVCQCDEILRAPLNPFRYWLRNYFGQAAVQAEARNKRNFNRIIDDLIFRTQPLSPATAEDLERVRSFLGALVDLHWPDSIYEQLDPQGRFENTLMGLETLLQAESLHHPVVLFFEDAHWLDQVSREFLPRLERFVRADKTRPYPLAVIATARREELRFVLGADLPYQVLELSAMPPADLERLAADLLEAPPSPALLQLLVQRTEGNPFYAEQVIRYLHEQGRLERVGEVWEIHAQRDGSLLPGDVRSLLVARLDRLAQQVRHVVQTAAILGREFEVHVLARMLRNEADFYDNVSTATTAAVWAPVDEIRYIFRHALMQDTAYRMLLRARRQALHAVAVEAMESLFEQELASHFGELAYHSEQAGLSEKARRYLTLAGDAACQVYQNQQAIHFFSQALELTPAAQLAERYHLLLKREQVYYILGDLDGQRSDLEALAELAELIPADAAQPPLELRRAQVLERRAGYALQVNDNPQAIQAAGQAVNLARAVAATDIAIPAYMTWSAALDHQGEYDLAIQRAEAALALARQAEDLRGQAQSLNMLGNIYWDKNELSQAYRCLAESLALAEQNGYRRIIAMASTNLGNLAATEGDLIACREYYLRALSITREIGERPKEGMILGNLGWITGMLGDYPAAQAFCEQNVNIVRQVGDQRTEALALINLSAYAGRQGDYPNALLYAEQALPLAAVVGDPSAEAWALTYLGHARLGAGQVESAENAYQQALAIRRRLNQPVLAAEPLAGLARAAMAGGEQQSALEHVAEIMHFLDGGGSLGSADEPLRVYLTCYQVLNANQDLRARQILKAGYCLLTEQAEKISDPSMRRTFLEAVPYHREISAAWEGEL